MNKIKGVNNKLDESLRKVGLFVYELENSAPLYERRLNINFVQDIFTANHSVR